MSRRTIYIIIIMAVISLGGIVVTQIYWVRNAFNFQEKQFNERAFVAMTSVVASIQQMNKDSSFVEPVEQISSNYFIANVNDTLHPYMLATMLKLEFEKINLKTDFEYMVYDCFDASIVSGGRVSFDSEDEEHLPIQEISGQKMLDKDGHYFGILFPNKSNIIVKQMDFWIFSSFLIFLIILFFAYTIMVILKQRRLSEVKTDFINNMTHELKTPISTIGISSEALLNKQIASDPDRLERYANIIKHENQRLKMQVDKVLQIATLSPKKINIKKEPIHLHQLVQNANESIGLLVAEKEGKIEFNLDAANDLIEGDVVHLGNVMYNLIDNALKYCEETPFIKIFTKNIKGYIVLSIQDNGIGMDQKHLSMIFDKFYRVPTGNTHNVKGFGLGLFYIKTMLEAHEGKIDVESEKGKGSIFTIKLKLKP